MLDHPSVATTERPDLVSSGAGLRPTAGESRRHEGGDSRAGLLGEVWLRFRRDKFAIAGGIYIVFVVLAGVRRRADRRALLGHGPDDQFSGRGRRQHRCSRSGR